MQLGMVGLGRMGSNMVRRLMAGGHECAVFDLDSNAVARLAADGAIPAGSLAELSSQLEPPRAVWVMVPAAFAGDVVREAAEHLVAGDVIIDGGNTFYRLDVARAAELAARGVDYLDVGTSGGVHGISRGYCLMVGGETRAVDLLAPIFDTLSPGVDATTRTSGFEGKPGPAERGWLHCGPSGAGHFVKMVHNGIEYGMMAAYAEGFAILEAADAGMGDRPADAETAPLMDPHHYRYDLDIPAIAELWRRGSVIGSWLLDLTSAALQADPTLAGYAGHVSDSGEGRWTVQTAVDLGVPAHVITAALYERFASRGNGEYAAKITSAMREQFGGHAERQATDAHGGG